MTRKYSGVAGVCSGNARAGRLILMPMYTFSSLFNYSSLFWTRSISKNIRTLRQIHFVLIWKGIFTHKPTTCRTRFQTLKLIFPLISRSNGQSITYAFRRKTFFPDLYYIGYATPPLITISFFRKFFRNNNNSHYNCNNNNWSKTMLYCVYAKRCVRSLCTYNGKGVIRSNNWSERKTHNMRIILRSAIVPSIVITPRAALALIEFYRNHDAPLLKYKLRFGVGG